VGKFQGRLGCARAAEICGALQRGLGFFLIAAKVLGTGVLLGFCWSAARPYKNRFLGTAVVLGLLMLKCNAKLLGLVIHRSQLLLFYYNLGSRNYLPSDTKTQGYKTTPYTASTSLTTDNVVPQTNSEMLVLL
jgi:hypothetical protein